MLKRLQKVASTQLQSEWNSTGKHQSSLEYCIALVRKYDYEGFLTTLLISDPKVRRRLFAIRALNVEIATIRESVTLKETGLGRLQFWKNAIDSLYNQSEGVVIPRHPVVQELFREGVVGGALPKRLFTKMVECRYRTMDDTPFKTMADLEKYFDDAVTPMFLLTFDFMGIKSNHLDHSASHFGKTIGLANFIRSVSREAQNRRVVIPYDLLIKYNLSQENIIRHKNPDKLRDIVFDMASTAIAHYNHAKGLKSLTQAELVRLGVDKHACPEAIFMAALPSKFYLERLQSRDFDAFDPSLTRRYGLLPVWLFYNKLLKRYYY